eukprot:3322931-Pyramimonas_sp.AAC.1
MSSGAVTLASSFAIFVTHPSGTAVSALGAVAYSRGTASLSDRRWAAASAVASTSARASAKAASFAMLACFFTSRDVTWSS